MKARAASKPRLRRSTSTADCMSTLMLPQHSRSMMPVKSDMNPPAYIMNDTGDNNPAFKNWRTLYHVINNPKIRLSLSGQPNMQGWKQIASNIDEITNSTVNRKIALDLRKENHGFINEHAVSLATKQDRSNKIRNTPSFLQSESLWLQDVCKRSEIRLISAKQFKERDFNHFTPISSPLIAQDEKSIAEMEGFKYERIPVQDMHIPTSEDIDTFINLVQQLHPDDWLHIHCKAGLGRTSTFAAMYLMLKNTDQLSLADIFNVLASLPPHYNLNPSCNTESESYDYRVSKYNLLVRFYDFTQDMLHHHYANNWSTWLAEQRSKEESQHTLRI